MSTLSTYITATGNTRRRTNTLLPDRSRIIAPYVKANEKDDRSFQELIPGINTEQTSDLKAVKHFGGRESASVGMFLPKLSSETFKTRKRFSPISFWVAPFLI